MAKTTQHTSNKLKLIINIITIIAFVALFIAARDKISQTFTNLFKVHAWILLLMIPIQILSYYASSRMYQELLRLLDEDIELKKLYKITLELNFVNSVFPSGGVSGISYYGLRLRKFGVSGAKSTIIQVIKFVLIFVSFQILLFVGLLSLSIAGKTNNLTILIATTLATLLLVGTAMMSFIIGSKERINAFLGFVTKALNKLIHIVRPKHPETIDMTKAREMFNDLHENYAVLRRRWKELKKPLLFALLGNLAEIMTIYVVYVAFGRFINPGAVIIAYAVANFAGFFSVLPGGVGVYEFLTVTIAVAAGVPPELAAPVTIMYRILSMLIQLPPGYYFYHRALRTKTDEI